MQKFAEKIKLLSLDQMLTDANNLICFEVTPVGKRSIAVVIIKTAFTGRILVNVGAVIVV